MLASCTIPLFSGAAEPPRLGCRRLMANPCAGSDFWFIWRQTANSFAVPWIGCMRCKRAWLASAELRTWANIFLPKSTSFRRALGGVPSTDCARSSIPTGYSKTNSSTDCLLTPGRRPPNDAGVSFDLDGTLLDFVRRLFDPMERNRSAKFWIGNGISGHTWHYLMPTDRLVPSSSI